MDLYANESFYKVWDKKNLSKKSTKEKKSCLAAHLVCKIKHVILFIVSSFLYPAVAADWSLKL